MNLFRISFSPGVYQVKLVREVWAYIKGMISDGEIVTEDFKKEFLGYVKDFTNAALISSPKSRCITITDTTTQVGYVVKVNNGESGAIHFHPIKRIVHAKDNGYTTLLPQWFFKKP